MPDLQGYPIEEYGYKLGRAWGVGMRDVNNGARSAANYAASTMWAAVRDERAAAFGKMGAVFERLELGLPQPMVA